MSKRKAIWLGVILATLPFLLLKLFSLLGEWKMRTLYEAASIGWSCDVSTFESKYLPLYRTEWSRLENAHEMVYETVYKTDFQIVQEEGENIVRHQWRFYADTHTVELLLSSDGSFEAYLYVFETDGVALREFSSQSSAVAFLNDFIGYAAYGVETEKDRFASLFQQAVDRSYDENAYLLDTGNETTKYSIALNRTQDGDYFGGEKDEQKELVSNLFSFKGYLKPLH